MSDVEANEEQCKNQWHDRSQEAGQWNGIHGTGGVNGWTKYLCHSWYWDTRSWTQKLLLFAHDLTLNFHNVWLLFYGQCATDLWRLNKRWIVRNGTMKKTPRFQNCLRSNHNPWVPEHVWPRYPVSRVLLHDYSSSYGVLVHLHKTSSVHQLQHSMLFRSDRPSWHGSQTRKEGLNMEREEEAYFPLIYASSY